MKSASLWESSAVTLRMPIQASAPAVKVLVNVVAVRAWFSAVAVSVLPDR